jgi:hypothetical protein
VSPIDWLAFGLNSGISVGPFDDEYFAIPLGLEVSASFGLGEASVLDMVVGFEWPAFVRPTTNSTDSVETSTWTLSAGARFYFGLLD